MFNRLASGRIEPVDVPSDYTVIQFKLLNHFFHADLKNLFIS